MNTPKKGAVLNNDWILCPSKTFPGKFYYFNVASGEAVWTLNSNEKTTPKKDSGVNVQNINNRFHSYPEPSTPPDDSPKNTPPNIGPNTSTSNSWPTNRKPYYQNEKYTFKGPSAPWPECKQTPFQNQMFAQQTPMFGQPPHFVTNLNPFMPTMPNVGMPSFVWTPMQLPMSQWPVMTFDRKPVIDRDTQTSQIDRGVFVHTSGVPLNEKFINYEKPSLYFNTENKLINKPKYFATSTPLKNNNSIMEFSQNHTPSKSIPDQVLNMETEFPMNNVFGKSISRTSDNEKATFNPCTKIKFPKKWVIEELEMEDKTNLHVSDLRILLNAKRKKFLEVNDPVEKKKLKIDEDQRPVKKRVSFEMDKTNETCIITDEQKRVNQLIPTTKCNSSFYEIRTSHTQNNINESNTFENKITKTINNIPKCDIQTHNEDVTNTQNDMTIDNITSKQYNVQTTNDIPACKMNISKKFDQNNIPRTENIDDCPKEVSKSMPQYKEVKPPEFDIEAPTVSPSYTVRDIWYLIVDIDVLLEDLALVDKLLKSDEKCRLVIPHCIHSQLEALCIGDCRGQQRVFVARQLIRRISTPQKQYIVQPPPLDENTNIETTDGILDCCMRVLENQYSVILITNNPYLREKASTQNICCFNTDEIRNGAILKPRLFSELKKIKVIVENENKNDTAGDDQEPASIPIDVYKKQLFVKDEQIEKNCDILVNITKPKMDQNLFKAYQFEINNRVQLNLEETENRQEYENQPPFLTQNKYVENKTNNQETENASHTNNFENLKARNQDPNTFNAKGFIPNTKSDTMTHKNITKSPEYFQTNNPQNSKIRFDSTPKDDNYLLRAGISDGIKTNETSDGNHTAYSRGATDVVSTASRQRIEKIISALNPKLPNNNTPNLKSFNKFKVPKLIPFKKETRITTALKGDSATTDSIRSNFQNYEQSLEGSLKKFYVKNTMMQEKLTTKMDEWICTYTQIMEHLLTDTLRNNSAYVRQMNVTNTNLHESLTCLKMLYNDTKLRKILQVLVKLLDQCTCSKGKIRLDTAPNDFMKMIGCGVLLVQALKTILPDFKVLDDYESILNCLISNIESKTIDVDPELLRPTAVCRSEIENTNKEARRNFSKNPSVIIEYLKKHYKAWSSFDHKQDGETSQTNDTQNGGYKVVRLSGKNINMLKIDNNKSLSYINKIKENNPILEKEAETKLVKLLDSYQLNQDLTIADNVHLEDGKQRKAALRKQSIFSIDSHTEISENDKEKTLTGAKTTIDNEFSTKNQPKLKKNTENIKQYSTDDRNENKEPNVISNIKILNEYETRMKNKEPLDLDHLDYSEINDSDAEAISSIFNENDFDNSDECNFRSDDFGCDNYKFNSTSSFFQACLANNNFSTIVNDNNSMRDKDMTEDDINDLQNKSLTMKRNLLMCKEIDKMEAIDIIKKTEANFDNSTRNPPRDDSTNDSGFENETFQVQTLVQIFFKELSNTFKVLYKFIVAFIQEIREEVLCEERKNLLHIKSSKRLQAIRAVIKQLKCIIERESAEATPFKATLLRYDLQATKDPRMSQYRRIIQKCLEQAEILQSALKIIVSVTIGDIDAMSTNANSICSSVKYLKIY